MKILKLLLFISLISSVVSNAQDKTLYVFDSMKKTPLQDVHIMDASSMIGYTDSDGSVSVPSDIRDLTIHFVGYRTLKFSMTQRVDTAYLVSAVYQMQDELVVYAGDMGEPDVRDYNNNSSHLTLDRMLNNVDGVSMIQRGAFAWEPTIRGLDDQRINLTIDGMQVFKACVDKMDPVTAYVESDNLSKLEIDKSGTGVAENGNGKSSINLVTKKPDFAPFKFNIKSGLRYPDYYRVLAVNSDISKGNHAIRFSGSIKQADNLVAGNDSTINNSGFNKVNLNLAYRLRTPSRNVLDVNYIFDDARNVGYPALLMDATRALANMLRVQYSWMNENSDIPTTSLLVYGNVINHQMDDYSRDVANRPVMRNMHMPMDGNTNTAGLKLSRNLYIRNQPTSLFVEGYLSKAFGDMKMESLFDIPDMYITNLGDIYTGSARIGAKSSFSLSNSLLLKLEESLEFNRVELTNDGNRSFFEGLYGKEVNPRARFLFSSSANLFWFPTTENLNFSFKAVYSQRQANYIELYGHYIYNYVDGYFYDGNPFLNPETTLNLEVGSQYQIADNALSVSVYYKQMYQYISGIIDGSISNQFFQFKRYENVGDVYMTGFELRWLRNWSNSFSSDVRTAYTYAQNTTLNEPLPLIPPLHGSVSTSYAGKGFSLSGILEWATEQSRIANQTTIEDQTDSFAVLNFELSRKWLNNSLRSTLSVHNVFDHYYNQHTSIGNIPESGRSFMLTLTYDL